MAKQTGSGSIRLVVMLLLGTVLITKGNNDIPALILFGDSTVDVGTNNYLPTLVKSDFRPYGRDAQSMTGTGRFSNGLLVNDFIAQDLGLPFPLAYLDPEAEGDKIVQGINFASSGSGWVDDTAQIFQVRSFTQQLQDFKDYKSKLVAVVGPSQAADIISNALYIVSTGSNDFVNNYFLNPVERDHYTLPQWQKRITDSAAQYLQEIYNGGAQKIVVASVPAIGCLPAAISLYGGGQNQCVERLNDAAVSLNSALQSLLLNIKSSLPGVQFLFLDIYSGLLEASHNPAAYGRFEEARNACCGTGKIEVAILCNADSPGTCSDASKYLFFDSFHPSQSFYQVLAQEAYERIMATF